MIHLLETFLILFILLMLCLGLSVFTGIGPVDNQRPTTHRKRDRL